MDYEQKYNKLVNAIKVLQETNPSDEGIQNWVNDNIPELAKSKDERIRKELIEHIKANSSSDFVLFQKFLPDDVIAWLEKQGEQKEWSEEDKSMYIRTLGVLGKCYMGQLPDKVEEELNWLKSLKQRYTWKPRDEQMKALDSAIDEFDGYREFDSLVSLKKDLEKLKRE